MLCSIPFQIPDLRKKSRRDYVKKRRVDKVEMLQEDIRDDEYLFEDSQLSKREKQEREYKKKVFHLAVEHAKAGELEKVQRYEMPQENQKPAKYDEMELEELGPNYEQKKWEEDKLGYAVMKFGAKDAKDKNKGHTCTCAVNMYILKLILLRLWKLACSLLYMYAVQ